MEYRYQLTARPVDIGTTPTGPGKRFTSENLGPWVSRGYGSVYYSEPLSLNLIEQYSLVPVTQIQALNGQHYTHTQLNGKVVRHQVQVQHEFELRLVSTLGDRTQSTLVSYAELTRRMEVQNWENVTDFENAVREILTNDDYAENRQEIDETYPIQATLEEKVRLHISIVPDWIDWFNGVAF